MLISLKPILYVGQVAYFQLNIDEIIEKYCVNKDKPQLECNGKCHLTKQLAQYDTTPTEDTTGIETINVKEVFTLVYIVTQSIKVPKKTVAASSKEVINAYTNDYSYLGISSCFKPPTFFI